MSVETQSAAEQARLVMIEGDEFDQLQVALDEAGTLHRTLDYGQRCYERGQKDERGIDWEARYWTVRMEHDHRIERVRAFCEEMTQYQHHTVNPRAVGGADVAREVLALIEEAEHVD